MRCRVGADSERSDSGSAKPERRERSGSSVGLKCERAEFNPTRWATGRAAAVWSAKPCNYTFGAWRPIMLL